MPFRTCSCSSCRGRGEGLFSSRLLSYLVPPACGCCPASGRGRLPAGDRKAARRAVPVGDAGALRASTAERDRMAARRVVPVRRRRSLTGIDSNARGSPSPHEKNTPPVSRGEARGRLTSSLHIGQIRLLYYREESSWRKRQAKGRQASALGRALA